MDPHDRCDVLINGAGPTGLVLAIWLKHLGVDVRIVDKTREPGTTSRALVVHARTLELYRQLDLARGVIELGLKFTAINLWARAKQVAHVDVGNIGKGLSPFPEMLIFPQDQHERWLIERLKRYGVEVQRSTELLGFEEAGGRIVARLKRSDGAEGQCEAAFLIGCDGAHSKVREQLAIGFPGGTYERMFYVADVVLRGPVANHELHVALDDADLLAVFPMKGEQVARLIGTVNGEAHSQKELTWADVNHGVVERLRITVERVNWFSTYRVHHRVAEHFRRGRVFLAGDAAHIHSPVGGQGMNTGIGDAINLAWKLASALQKRVSESVLDSYEPERRAFAERLVATTDRAFTFASQDGPIARRLRLNIFPAFASALMSRTSVRRFAFRTLSQTLVNYRASAVSQGKAGSVRGGDRLPWVAPAHEGDEDNFTPLSSLDWQVHVYGAASRELSTAAGSRGVPIHTFSWSEQVARAGLANNAAYLVRPDGYVALADPQARPEVLLRYLDELQIKARPS